MFRRNAQRRPTVPTLLAHVCVVVVMCAMAKLTSQPSREAQTFQRHLLSTELNCTPRSIEEFPPDFMTRHQRQQGGVVFHFVLAFYLLAALAIVCDEFFVAALERICEVTKLKPDVAGATFMAAGSSAPELFTSIVGVFFAKSDVGVSTIVGSAVFNILFIVALIGLLAGMTITLSWWPLFRDSFWYCGSIVALIIVIHDGEVHWYESLIMLIMYALYIVIMYYNETLETFVSRWMPAALTSRPLSEHTPLVESEADLSVTKKASGEDGDMEASKEDRDKEEDAEPFSPFKVPESLLARCYWVAMFPASLVFFLLIPDCRRPRFRRFFFLTFLMSIVFIAGLSYILVWMVCLIGDTLDAPDTVMGLTFLAAGTSVPDALASVFVARDGYGDMAVSNSVGSNIFDILLCLGLPWLLSSSVVQPGTPVAINSEGLVYSTITLLSTVILLVFAIALNRWRINRFLGGVFLVIYFVVIVFSCLYELNVFGGFNAVPCPRKRE